MSDFSLPTPEQVADHLERHPPRMPSAWAMRAPLLALGAVLVIALLAGEVAMLTLPWVALLGVFGYLAFRVRRARGLEHGTTRVQELALLRRHGDAAQRAWALVPAVRHQPNLYVRCVALLAQCLQHLKAYEAAIVGYDSLLQHLPADHPGAVQLRAHRALAALHSDRLADADDTLREMRSHIEPYADTPIGATYRLAELTQAVRTCHYAEALERAGEAWLEDLRPLGIDAGFGHALLALCHREDRTERDGDARQAAIDRWWRRATLLLPEAALVDRYPELGELCASPRSHAADDSR